MLEAACFSCHKELKFAQTPGFREECPHCRADVHVCKNCRHYDPKVYNECKETQADVVREKERANYCEYFVLRTGGGAAVDERAAQLAAAEALFKKMMGGGGDS